MEILFFLMFEILYLNEDDICYCKTSKAPAELDKRQLFEANWPVHKLLVTPFFLRFPQTSHLICFGPYSDPPYNKKSKFSLFFIRFHI